MTSLLWATSLQQWCPFANPEISTWRGFWNVFTAFVTICDNAIGLTSHGCVLLQAAMLTCLACAACQSGCLSRVRVLMCMDKLLMF